jgi:DNA helicase-2/ATP-dependent DNA helicase PcrA
MTAGPAPFERVQAGQKVFHARFGEGVVLEVVDKGDDQEVTVEFARHGRKRLSAALANLAPIVD